MRPVILPLALHAGRLALRGRGVSSRWVETPHGRIHAYDARGSGRLPTTVLLHGIGSAATPFGPVLGHLKPHVRRIVAPDYPGHGFSGGATSRLSPEVLFDSVSAALDELIVEPAVVVGNSLGGAVALRYALSRPDRVRGLVLVSPAGAHSTDDEWDAIKSAYRFRSRADVLQFLRRVYHKPPWFLHLLAHEFPAALGAPPIRSLLEAAGNDHLPSPTEIGSLSVPVLLLWGESEKLLPQRHFEYFQRHLPRHSLVERPSEFGHAPHLEKPFELADRIARFARTIQ